jgi:DNA-binding NtrC family response regulator
VVVNPLGVSDREFEAELVGSGDGAGALRSAEGGTVYIEEFDSISMATLVRITEAVESKQYSLQGSTRRRRLLCRIMAGCTHPLEADPKLEAIQGNWKASQVFVPPLRDHKEDLTFHLVYLARRLCPGKSLSMLLGREDQQTLAMASLPGNFYDLRTALIRGVDALKGGGPSHDGEMQWERLAGMPWTRFEHIVRLRYLRSVVKLHGRNVTALENHIGCSRAQVYRHLKTLDTPDG